MQALILAAGTGNRLSGAANYLPKCLLEFNNQSLLERHIHALTQNGIRNITIVTGYQAETVRNNLSEIKTGNTRIKTVQNDNYSQGSVVSLWAGRNVLISGEQVILMDADVLYSVNIIRRLVNSDNKNCFVIDRNFETGDEPVKLCINNNRIVEFRKVIDHDLKFDTQGESVGFFSFSPEVCQLIVDITNHYVENNRRDQPYEEVIRDVVLANNELFGYEDITGLPWVEIDFPEDIERAINEILPDIETGV